MIRTILHAVIVMAVWVGAGPVWGAEPEILNEKQFEERVQGLATEREAAKRLHVAVDLVAQHLVSSVQVKAIAARLSDDAARLEFAIAAYPRTVDPENFYDVYDAFTSFSRMMRLHDWIREQAPRPRAPIVVVAGTVSDKEMRDIVQALRKESFDEGRDKLGRQILSSSRKGFLAAQIKEMLKCFAFEDNRLEFAKFAYDYTLNREQYFQVNEAFTFSSSRDSLAQYIQAKNQPSAPKRH